MLEVEVKMRLADRAALEARLGEAGAERRARLMETNLFLDLPGGVLRKADRGLRIRRERDIDHGAEKIIITHKGPRRTGDVKQREETEVEADSMERAVALFEALGFERGLCFDKRRDKWRLGDCEVCVDEMPRLGQFVEIEGPEERAVLEARELLGLGSEALIRESYATLLCEAVGEGIADCRLKIED